MKDKFYKNSYFYLAMSVVLLTAELIFSIGRWLLIIATAMFIISILVDIKSKVNQNE